MPPQQSQQISPEDAKAGLGIATHLQSFLLPQKGGQTPVNNQPAQDPTQGAPSNQETGTDVKAEMSGLESRLMDELQTLRAEMKTQGDGKAELENLKKQIEQILNSND